MNKMALLQKSANDIARDIEVKPTTFNWLMQDANQKARELENFLNDRHQFYLNYITAYHDDFLTPTEYKILNDPAIPYKEMPFLYNVVEGRAESLLGIWMAMLKSAMASQDVQVEEVRGFQDRLGADRILQADAATTSFRVESTQEKEESGISIGTGTTAVTLYDNKLVTPIIDGVTAGTIKHEETQVSAMLLIDDEASFRIARSFGNMTSSTITAEEIGLQVLFGDAATTAKEFFIARDLRTIPIDENEHIVETYQFKLTT